jgi:hypothetical protein
MKLFINYAARMALYLMREKLFFNHGEHREFLVHSSVLIVHCRKSDVD